MQNINVKDFHTTRTSQRSEKVTTEDIVSFVKREFTRFKDARSITEDVWLEAWSLYLATPQTTKQQRADALHTVGNVSVDWRHAISTGKAYEIVETVHSYLMAATFPNSQWFSVEPTASGYAPMARVVKKYLANKLDEANFKVYYAQFLRQLLITGTSVMALPWRYETRKCKKNVVVNKVLFDPLLEAEYTKKEVKEVEEERVFKNHPSYEVLDAFDIWVDPSQKDPNAGALIRRIEKTRAEVVQLVNEDYYDLVKLEDVYDAAPSKANESPELDALEYYQGLSHQSEYSMADSLELIEYWGDVHIEGVTFHDVCATMLGNTLLKFEPNPFWVGRPFVVGTLTPLTQTPYSMGLLQPSLGLLHELNIISNQRLDNLELSTDAMLLVRQDGVLNPEDIGIAPGKILYVNDPSAIQAFALPNTSSITYQEGAVLEQTIDKIVGTGALISANAARSGERVTAAEIQATRDAGGNRLSGIQSHIESTSLKSILNKTYRNAQQFVTEDELVRVTGAKTGEFQFFTVGADELQYDFRLKPVGAEHVIDRNKYVQDRLQLMQAVAQVPQMAERINYEAILYDIVQHFGFDDPDAYIITEEQMQAKAQAMTPQSGSSLLTGQGEQELSQQALEAGGLPMQQAVDAQLMGDGGQQMMQELTGVDIDPMQTQLEQAALEGSAQ